MIDDSINDQIFPYYYAIFPLEVMELLPEGCFLVASWQGLGERLHVVRANKKLNASTHGPWPFGNRFMAPNLGTRDLLHVMLCDITKSLTSYVLVNPIATTAPLV